MHVWDLWVTVDGHKGGGILTSCFTVSRSTKNTLERKWVLQWPLKQHASNQTTKQLGGHFRFFSLFSFCSRGTWTLVVYACYGSCWWFPCKSWFPFCFFGIQHIQRHQPVGLFQVNNCTTKTGKWNRVNKIKYNLSNLHIQKPQNISLNKNKTCCLGIVTESTTSIALDP